MNSTTPEVHLEIFEGPLDLLLYLIRKDDLNIYDIPISQITSEYLNYLDLMKEMKLDMAGEFLVMASTLMQIKARQLLPSPKSESDEGPDPRSELINRLLEYQRYKLAAKEMERRVTAHRDIHYRGAPILNESDYTLETSLFDLLDAFRDVLKGLKPDVREILYEEVPIEVKIREIFTFLEGKTYATFKEILQRETTRRGLIITFLAVLELIRLKQIAARQGPLFGEIHVYRVQETGGEVPPEAETAPSEGKPLPQEVDAVKKFLSRKSLLEMEEAPEEAPAPAAASEAADTAAQPETERSGPADGNN